jgi:proteasome accessory factor C
VLEALRRAVIERRRVRIEHHSASRGRLTERAVDPYRMLDYGGIWYLLAMDGQSGEQRFFRVDRITRAEPADEGFEPPPSDRVLGQLPTPYAEPHAAEHARVQFAGDAARWARERWADHIDEEASSRETTVAVIPYLKESWIIGELLPFVGTVSVLQPGALVESFRDVTEEMAGRYAGPPAR